MGITRQPLARQASAGSITAPSPISHLPSPRSAAARRGGALLTVLWLSAALAAIAFSLASTVRGEAERAGTAVDGTRAYYLASGAIYRTTLHLLWFSQNPNLPPQYRPTTRVVDMVQFPTGEVRVEIVPETSRLDINTATPEQIFRLLMNLGVDAVRAQEIAAAVLDWRSPAPPEGPTAFDAFYMARNPSFRVRHASLEETEELLQVRGMTPDIYYGTWQHAPGAAEGSSLVRQTGFADCVSVFGTAGRFDANTTHPAVLASVGVPPDVAAAVEARRRVAPFLNDADLARFLQGAAGALDHLRVGGNSIYTLRATARLRLPDGRLSDLRRTVAAQVKFMPPGYDSPYHILRWYENAWERP